MKGLQGRVVREVLFNKRVNPDVPEYELLLGKNGFSKIFADRQAALDYFHNVEHYSRDDMRFVFWLNSEDIRCEIFTGRYLETDTSVDLNSKTCNGFWYCDVCGNVYRKTEHVKCPQHPDQHMDDNSDALVEELLERDGFLTQEEKEIILEQIT